jgi:hypothetical protein
VKLGPEILLVGAVVAVGALHTLVPDHWVPIAVVARQRRWTRAETARAAAVAGLGHILSTLAIGVLVWFAGIALVVRFANLVSLLASVALVVFGLWVAGAALRELHATRGGDDQRPQPGPNARCNARTMLLLTLGSSPMVEGIPAFFAAASFGAGLLVVMAACFAISTIAVYVALCVYSHAALQSLSLGPLESYGEVFSGAIIAIVGIVFALRPFA